MKTTYLLACILLLSSCDLFWTPLEQEIFPEDHFLAITNDISVFSGSTHTAHVIDIDSNLVKEQSFLFTNFEDILNKDEEIWVFKDDIIRKLDQGNLDLNETVNKPVALTSANHIIDDLIYSVVEDSLFIYDSDRGVIQERIDLISNSQNHQFFQNFLYYSTESTLIELDLNSFDMESVEFEAEIIEVSAEEFKLGVLTGSSFNFHLFIGFDIDNMFEINIDENISQNISFANKNLGFIKNKTVLLSDGLIYLTESTNEIAVNDQLDFDEVRVFDLNYHTNFIYAFNRDVIQYYDIDKESMGELEHAIGSFRRFFIID